MQSRILITAVTVVLALGLHACQKAPTSTGGGDTTSIPTHLAVVTQPSTTVQSGSAFVQQPAVQLLDDGNAAVHKAGVAVTASLAIGTGALAGTTTASTNAIGVATFTDLAVTGAGPASLKFASTGLADVTSASFTVAASSGTPPALLFEEDFEDVNFAARGWYDIGSGGMTSITTAQHIPGSTKSLQANWAQGATTPSPSTGARHLFAPSDAVYLRFWVKHSSNWVGSGKPYHPHLFHFLTTLDDQYVGPSWTHLTTYVEENVQADGGHAVLAAQDGANIDPAHINEDLTSVTENRAVSGCNGNPDGAPSISCYQIGTDWYNGKGWTSSQPVFVDAQGPAYKGDWHKVEAYFKLNSIVNGIGQRDGVAQYWVDGALILDRQDVIFRTGAHPTMQFNQLLMAPYIGDGSPVAQTLWFDDLVVMTGPPLP